MSEVEMLRYEVDRLQKMVDDLEIKVKTVPRSNLAAVTTETPIWDYTNTNNPDTMEEVVFAYRYDKSSSPPWKPFTMLAKELCRTDPVFYMSSTYSGSKTPYVRADSFGELPKRFENIPFERLVLAGEMIDEMTRIWNRYYKMVHKTAKGKEFKHSSIQTILANEDTYRGNYRYGKEACENTHDPILTT